MIELNGGIRIGKDLIIDPTRVQAAAAVSHAHSDHLRRHKKIFATQPTLDFSRNLIGEFSAVPIEYGRTYRFDSATLRPEPAGHILGSAQFVIDYKGYRIVYTGDFKLSPNETCEPARIHECDILFIDTTFGKKLFNFPEYGYIKQRLAEFVEASIYAGEIPVIFAYSTGKAQEVMKMLGDAGFNTYVVPHALENAGIHARHGFEIMNCHLLTNDFPENGAVILPPGFKKFDELFLSYRKRTCFVSGWALYPGFIRAPFVDEFIPLSDHASYDDLIKYIELADPKKIFCLFGFKDIVEDLKYRGYNAIRATLANRKKIGRFLLQEMSLFGDD